MPSQAHNWVSRHGPSQLKSGHWRRFHRTFPGVQCFWNQGNFQIQDLTLITALLKKRSDVLDYTLRNILWYYVTVEDYRLHIADGSSVNPWSHLQPWLYTFQKQESAPWRKFSSSPRTGISALKLHNSYNSYITSVRDLCDGLSVISAFAHLGRIAFGPAAFKNLMTLLFTMHPLNGTQTE